MKNILSNPIWYLWNIRSLGRTENAKWHTVDVAVLDVFFNAIKRFCDVDPIVERSRIRAVMMIAEGYILVEVSKCLQ